MNIVKLLKKGHKMLRSKEMMIKIVSSIAIIIVLYILLNIVRKPMDLFLSGAPYISGYYLFIKGEIAARTLLGLFCFSFLSSLFFISFPSELFFIWYAGHYNVFIVAIVIIAASMLGQAVNYLLGLFLGKKVLHIFIHKTKKEFGGFFRRHSRFIIVFVNIFPLGISDILTTFLGTLGYSKRRLFLGILIGITVKYIILIAGLSFFTGVSAILVRLFVR